MRGFRTGSVGRLAVGLLCSTALPLLATTALAATFNVGGGTINTTQADNSTDNTGTSGGFALQPNTTGNNDIVTISGVTINNTSGAPTGRALDLGYTLSSSGPYSITMQGSNLTSAPGSGVAAFIASSAGGSVSFDSTVGAANTVSGPIGINLNGNGGNISIRTGADTITTSGASGEILYATTTGTGTISIDTAGATLTSSGLYGISAISGGSGTITLGGLNGGIASTINVTGGSGIYTSSTSNQNITLASSGVINALNGMTIQGNVVTVNSFGAINASNNAIAALGGTGPLLTVTLEASSITSGRILGGTAADTFNVVAGANIAGATFDGATGGDTLTLTGSGNGSFTLSSLSNVEELRKSGAGTWTLTGPASYGFSNGIAVDSGVLQIGSNDAVSVGGNIANNGSVKFNRSGIYTYSDAISGSGTVSQSSSGTLILSGTNTYTGGTVVDGGTLQVGDGGATGSISGNVSVQAATLAFNRADTYVFSGNITKAGTGFLTQKGTGKLILTGTIDATTTVTSGSLQIGNGGTTGSITGAITTSAPIIFNRSDTAYWDATITGTGSFEKVGSNRMVLIGSFEQTGGTTISGGILQVGDGTNNPGYLRGNVVDNGSLVFNGGAADWTMDGVISGSGSLVKHGVGNLILSGNNSYLGGTTINGGTLTVGAGGTTGTIAGNIINNGTLTFNRSDSITVAGNISGSGGVIKLGAGTLILTGTNTYNVTQISAGTLQIGNGGTSGSISGDIFNRGMLVFDRSDDITFTGNMAGPGGFIKQGAGKLTLTGTSTISGNQVVNAGTLRLGSSLAVGFGSSITTAGSIEYANGVNIPNRIILAGNGVQLRVPEGAAIQAAAISGAQPLEKTGQGTLTLSGTNTHTGVTAVSAGTLNITGALSNSNTTVANGGTLTGTGSVRNVTVASGGTVGPSGTGTLTVLGNLTLNNGATYADSITPSTAGLTNVSGAASLNGAAAISAGAGTYTAGQRYTLVTASGGLSGTFASLSTPNLPGYVKGRLGYDANNAYLYLDPNAITPLLPSGASLNQISLAAGIDAGLQQGTPLNSGFTALFNLQGAALGDALNQIAGQGAPNIATAGGQSLSPFLSVMQSQGGFGGNGPDTAANFAPGNLYGAADAPRRAQIAPGAMRVWGSVYGGHAGISANAATGAASLSANNVGFVAGGEVSLTDGLRLGASAGFGSQDFSSANSTGDSDDVMLGLYARQDILESGYITAAFAYSWHDIATTRTITVAGTDVLGAKFDAHAIGGRLEGGWRLALDEAFGLTPFAAFAGDNFYVPAYAEGAISGSSSFALTYAANKTVQKHTEFGAHLDHAVDLGGGDMLSADARAAWAHQLDDAPFVTAAFQGLPGSTFRLLGVRAATDTALLGLGLKIQNPDGLSAGLRMDSQLGAGTTVLQGMGTLAWRW